MVHAADPDAFDAPDVDPHEHLHGMPGPGGDLGGATYHGAIQLTVGPSGHRMKGQWAGFGKDGEVNSGPWTLNLVSSDTGIEAIEKFSRAPE